MPRPNIFTRMGMAWDVFRHRHEESTSEQIFGRPAPASFPNKWAVLIGINKYDNDKVPDLLYASSDAISMGKAIRESLEFPKKNITTFHEKSKLKPSRNNIFHELQGLRNRGEVGKEDLLVFYFSGHGMFNSVDGLDYLLPKDGFPDTLQKTALKVDELIEELKGTNCNNIVIFMDACREKIKGGKGVQSFGQQSKEATKRQGVVQFFSCDPQDLSYEIEKLEHGSFTHCILQAIDDANCNTVLQLDKYLRDTVPTINVDNGMSSQQPYAIIEPADKAELEILFSQAKVIQTKEQLEAWEKKLGDALTAEKPEEKLEYKYFQMAVAVLDRAKNNRMMADDADFLKVIQDAFDSNVFSKKAFEIYWDAVKRRRRETPQVKRKLERLE